MWWLEGKSADQTQEEAGSVAAAPTTSKLTPWVWTTCTAQRRLAPTVKLTHSNCWCLSQGKEKVFPYSEEASRGQNSHVGYSSRYVGVVRCCVIAQSCLNSPMRMHWHQRDFCYILQENLAGRRYQGKEDLFPCPRERPSNCSGTTLGNQGALAFFSCAPAVCTPVVLWQHMLECCVQLL